jgi:hypothetical protein
LYELGLPWANARLNDVIAVRDQKHDKFPHRKKPKSAEKEGTTAKKSSSSLGDFSDFLKAKMGTIVQ